MHGIAMEPINFLPQLCDDKHILKMAFSLNFHSQVNHQKGKSISELVKVPFKILARNLQDHVKIAKTSVHKEACF